MYIYKKNWKNILQFTLVKNREIYKKMGKTYLASASYKISYFFLQCTIIKKISFGLREKKRMWYRFEMTQEYINDKRMIILGWTISLKQPRTNANQVWQHDPTINNKSQTRVCVFRKLKAKIR